MMVRFHFSQLPMENFRRTKFGETGLAARSNLGAPSKDALPNPNRSLNPFNPKNEPDWVVVPNPTAAETERNQKRSDTKPTVVQNSTPPRQANAKQRPLPSLMQDKASKSALEPSSAPPLRPPSSPGSKTIRKPAPPIPRKPPMLTSKKNDIVDSGRIPSSVSSKQSIPVRWTNVHQHLEAGRPTLAACATSRASPQIMALKSAPSSDHNKNQNPQVAGADRVPALPSRAPTVQRPVPTALLDKPDEGACLIPSIQPTRRQA